MTVQTFPDPSERSTGATESAAADRWRTRSAKGIFVIVAIFATYAGRSFLVPIVVAVLGAFVLAPAVRRLKRLRAPGPVAAALVLGVVIVASAGAVYRLAGPAAAWIDEMPRTLRRVQTTFAELAAPVASVRDATDEVERMTELDGEREEPQTVEVAGTSLSNSLFELTIGLIAQLVFALVLLFALLSSGERILGKLATLMPGIEKRRELVVIARRTELRISSYLLTVTVINAILGLATALAMYLIGMPNPFLWGVLAWVLNYVPVLGAMAGTAILLLAAATEFIEPWHIALPPLTYALITGIEGYFITPHVLSHRLTLNLVTVVLSLFFWGWLWGPVGVLLAVPMLATVKIISEQIDALRPLSELLER